MTSIQRYSLANRCRLLGVFLPRLPRETAAVYDPKRRFRDDTPESLQPWGKSYVCATCGAERADIGLNIGETQAPRQTASVQALRNAQFVEVIAHGRKAAVPSFTVQSIRFSAPKRHRASSAFEPR